MPGPICRCCASPHRKEIDAALLDKGTTLREITERYGIPKSTLHQHKSRCMGAPPRQSAAEHNRRDKEKREKMAAQSRVAFLESSLPSKEVLGDVLGSCIDRLETIVSRCEESGADAIAINGIDAIRKQVSELARLGGHVGNAQQINVGVQLNLNANDIGAAIAANLSGVQPIEAIEILGEVE